MLLLPPIVAVNNSPTHQFPPPHPPPLSTTSIATALSHPSPPSVRRLTNREMQIRRERGLCFPCDERFSSGHCYKQKTLQVLWVMDKEEEGTNVLQSLERIQSEEETTYGPKIAALCVSSLVAFCSPQSMKVRGRIESREVIVHIDSGASHNFITENLVSELHLQCTPT